MVPQKFAWRVKSQNQSYQVINSATNNSAKIINKSARERGSTRLERIDVHERQVVKGEPISDNQQPTITMAKRSDAPAIGLIDFTWTNLLHSLSL